MFVSCKNIMEVVCVSKFISTTNSPLLLSLGRLLVKAAPSLSIEPRLQIPLCHKDAHRETDPYTFSIKDIPCCWLWSEWSTR